MDERPVAPGVAEAASLPSSRRPRRWWLLGGAVLAIAVLLAALASIGAPGAADSTEAGKAIDPPVASVAEAAEPVVASTQPTADAVPPSAEWTQICGGEWVPTQPDGGIDEAAFQALPSMRNGVKRLYERLASSPDEFDRAVAAVLDSIPASPANDQPAAAEPEPCHAACREAQMAAWRHERAAQLDALARLALATRDPKVYALAYRLCPREEQDGTTCGMLSAEQWARLDDGNGVPWLYVAGEAAQRGDTAARDAALFRFASASRYETYWLAGTARLIDKTEQDVALQTPAYLLGFALSSTEAGAATPIWQTILQSCRGIRMESDPNRWQLCSATAERLIDRSDSALDRGVAIAMARRLGWPAERTDRLRGEMVALLRAYTAQSADAASAPMGRVALDCATIRHTLTQWSRLGHQGELAVMRASLGASAPSDSDYVRIGREEREQREREEASVRSEAASAPASSPASAPAPNAEAR